MVDGKLKPLQLILTASILGFGFALGGTLFRWLSQEVGEHTSVDSKAQSNPAIRGGCVGCGATIRGVASGGHCSACGTYN